MKAEMTNSAQSANGSLSRMSVVLVLRGQSEPSSSASKHQFWDAVRQKQFGTAAPAQKRPTDDDYEASIRQSFGQHLRSTLTSHIYGYARDDQPKALPPVVNFRVTHLWYGSIGLNVDVTGLAQLAQLFDNNFEALEIALSTFIPIAFSQAVQETARSPSPYTLSGGDFSVESMDMPRQVLNVLPAAVTAYAPAGPMETSKSARFQWAWVLSNTSLIPAVLLALYILYVAFDQTRRDRDSAAEIIKESTRQMQYLIDQYAKRIDSLERERSSATAAVSQAKK